MKKTIKLLILISLSIYFLSIQSIFADQTYVPGELIIKLDSSITNVEEINTLDKMPGSIHELAKFLGVKKSKSLFRKHLKTQKKDNKKFSKKKRIRQEILRKSSIKQMFKLTFETTDDMENIARQFMNNAEVEFAEPNYYLEAFITPNDPNYSSQWHLPSIDCPAGWSITTGSAQVIVAVIDSGTRRTHEDLASKLWINPGDSTVDSNDNDGNGYEDDINGWDFVNNDNNPNDGYGHGTRVAGIIAAHTNNSKGVAGVDWGAKIMTLRALNNDGKGTIEDIVDSIYYCMNNNADVINMSLGTISYSSSLDQACNSAYRANIVLVAAMGNNGSSTVYYPAGLSEVIGVGATNSSDERASFSTYGSGSQITELVAPGVDIYSTTMLTDSAYGYMGASQSMPSGTSFSAPQVAGLASLLLAKEPTMKPAEIRERMHTTAIDLGTHGPDKYYGFGKISIKNALENFQPSGQELKIIQMMNFPNPADSYGTNFSFYLNDHASITIQIYTPHGELLKELDGGVTNGGYHKTHWDCRDNNNDLLPNGSYIYVIIAKGDNVDTTYKKGKMAMLK